ncbi:probable membrane-associated kinase regulator 2 isoform X1 [Zingiber officinale]|uniref:probable membrane-associated kinase regulator 2 isoform X1 n=1 Tax=Zingiber officinale TaxID=94328 RepID=UPI001C4D63EC|nr:probable membrane-associated kinase regulator 2 isoform X1 [Zingiber officinale]
MKLLRLLTQAKQGGGPLFLSSRRAAIVTTTISTTVDFGGGGDCEDDGPFFDLEFMTLPLQDGARHALEKQQQKYSDAESDEEADEFELAMSPEGARCGLEGCGGGSLRRMDGVAVFSDDLFLKGRLFPLQPPLLGDFAASEPGSSTPQVPAFVNPAAKFRAFKLGFRRKSNSSFPPADPADKPFVNFKTEAAAAAAAAHFTRDISSRSSCSSSSGASRFPKDVLHRYISKIKPLYVLLSKRYSKKLRFSGPLVSSDAGKVRPAGELGEDGFGDHPKDQPSAASGPKRSLKAQDANIPAGLRVVCRRLRKSRSASAAVSFRSPSLASGRRDDSLLEQQDGIQSAIAHCKRSFNKGSESPLTRSRSDPGDGRSAESSRSCDVVVSSSSVPNFY